MRINKKKLEDYRLKQAPILFLTPMKPSEPEKKSSTIELYDAIPKYVPGKTSKETRLTPIKRSFMFRGQMYEATIHPARIENKDGQFQDKFPGQREEFVEDALRKMASDGHGCYLDDYAGVTFSLYQLRQELIRIGHTYSFHEITEALLVCNQTHIKLSTADGKYIIGSNMFESLGIQTRDEWKDKGRRTKCFVRFNGLVTDSIRERTFRQINYEQCMSYKLMLARWLHKRMSHLFIQASSRENYTIRLSTIIRDSGVKQYKEIRNNIRDIKNALDEMVRFEVLSKYEIELKKDQGGKGRKIVDARFTLFPGITFISEMKEANKIFQSIQPAQTNPGKLVTLNR